jgi:RHS repeat-associated protein
MSATYRYDATPPRFTGKERDPESGLDNFDARYNSSSMGRFMTPDPLLKGAFLGNESSKFISEYFGHRVDI